MNAPRYAIERVEAGERAVRLALPFRFGDTRVTGTAEAYLRVTVEGPSGVSTGVAAQLMVPRWFDKRPERTNEDTVDDLRRTVLAAMRLAPGLAGTARSVSRDLRSAVEADAPKDLPRLAAGFGPALVEMALLDAVCRDLKLAFSDAARRDAFGLAEDAPNDIPAGAVADALARIEPQKRIRIRHTVGHDSPLDARDVADRPPDGRPVALEEAIARDGVQAFKIKLKGDVAADLDRLSAVAARLDRVEALQVTLDANEQYDRDGLAELVRRLAERDGLARLRRAVLYIEQPFAREEALAPPRLDDFGFPLVIDESDDADDALPRALDAGWNGVSVKSCKGVLRGLLNAARVAHAASLGRRVVLSAEDLTCQPGLSWQQDTLVAATVGATHAERNGHHFAGGFQGAPEAERRAYLNAHPDLYCGTAAHPKLRIADGVVALDSLFSPGFGSDPGPDFAALQPIGTTEETPQ